MKLAVISDTHGLLRDSVLASIGKPDLILHAGDVGTPEIIGKLKQIAPTHAVRGNVDYGALATNLPPSVTIDLPGGRIHMVHDIEALEIDVLAPQPRLVIFGHSHRPDFYETDGVAYLNPGSIGPRRFKLPISFATIEWNEGRFTHRFVALED